MTLTTHIAIAAAATQPFAQSYPMLGFFAALASHYLADAVPHWDYGMHAIGRNEQKLQWSADQAHIFRRRVIRDIGHFAVDGLLGVGITLLLTRPVSAEEWLWIIGAIAGGILPDFLQGAYLSGAAFLRPLQRFHDRCHTKIKLGPYPLIGIPLQIIILFIAISFLL